MPTKNRTGLGVFSRQCERQLDPATPLGQILLMDGFYLSQVFL